MTRGSRVSYVLEVLRVIPGPHSWLDVRTRENPSHRELDAALREDKYHRVRFITTKKGNVHIGPASDILHHDLVRAAGHEDTPENIAHNGEVWHPMNTIDTRALEVNHDGEGLENHPGWKRMIKGKNVTYTRRIV